MSSLEKLRQFRKKIDKLSGPIKDNLAHIQELDRECLAKQRFVEQLAVSVIQNWTKSQRELRVKRFKSIKIALEKMEELANKKVEIASRNYETVDNYVVQLDKLYAKITQQKIRKLRTGENTESKRSGRKSEVTVEADVAEKFDPTCYVDMPVDPNEPTYCFCHQVSFGQMICCDNKNCPIEWFHFGCVDLENEPKGKWFCSLCSTKK